MPAGRKQLYKLMFLACNHDVLSADDRLQHRPMLLEGELTYDERQGTNRPPKLCPSFAHQLQLRHP